ncbi:MAG TPA: adhesin [Nitrolancea sp.]|nr:adhesin [Nitrolancea sp.]
MGQAVIPIAESHRVKGSCMVLDKQEGSIFVVHITDRAMDQLEAMRDQSNLPEGQGVALTPREGGKLGFTAATPTQSDEVIERDGATVMIIPNELIEPLQSVVIDYVDTPEMQGFTLNPEEQA